LREIWPICFAIRGYGGGGGGGDKCVLDALPPSLGNCLLVFAAVAMALAVMDVMYHTAIAVLPSFFFFVLLFFCESKCATTNVAAAAASLVCCRRRRRRRNSSSRRRQLASLGAKEKGCEEVSDRIFRRRGNAQTMFAEGGGYCEARRERKTRRRTCREH
jgi:hypothetical protein